VLPAHCRVNGVLDRRMGSDGKAYGIRFAIALPENWTG
jgi:feruloyl esterase